MMYVESRPVVEDLTKAIEERVELISEPKRFVVL